MYTNLRARMRLIRKFRPIIESLEDRRVLSALGTHPLAASHPPNQPDTPAHAAQDDAPRGISHHEHHETMDAASHGKSAQAQSRHEDNRAAANARHDDHGAGKQKKTNSTPSAGDDSPGTTTSNESDAGKKDPDKNAESPKGDNGKPIDAPGATGDSDHSITDDSPADPKSDNPSAKKDKEIKAEDGSANPAASPGGEAVAGRLTSEDGSDGPSDSHDSGASRGKARTSRGTVALLLSEQGGDHPLSSDASNSPGSIGVNVDSRSDNLSAALADKESGTAAEGSVPWERIALFASPRAMPVAQAGGDEEPVVLLRRDSTSDDECEGLDLSESMPAGLLGGVVPLDWQALDQGMQQFLDQLDHLGAEFTHGLAGARLPSWLLAVGLAATACEVARRQVKPTARRVFATGDARTDTVTWLPSRDPEPTRG